MSGMLPENMKPILAKYMADTLDDTMSEDLAKDIVANMDPSIKIVSDTDMDPNAVHLMNGMKKMLDQTMEQLQATMQKNQELTEQIKMMNIQVMNMKGQQAIDWNKFMISEDNKTRLKEAELMAQGVKIDNEAKADANKAMIEGQKVALKAEEIKNDAVKTAIDATNTMGGY